VVKGKKRRATNLRVNSGEMEMIKGTKLVNSKAEIEEHKNFMELDEKPLQENGEIVLIGTNRWLPDKCMWTVEKNLLSDDITVVFPFPELSASICHVFIGTTNNHKCFIHLTPLTSLFRRSTDELDKIIVNLNNISNDKENWYFQVYFFDYNDYELKFRNIISQVLGKSHVTFIAMKPKGYKQGEINLLFQMNTFFYSTQDTKLLITYRDVSSIGSYNSIPIYAYE
jgi:hypothetical protein